MKSITFLLALGLSLGMPYLIAYTLREWHWYSIPNTIIFVIIWLISISHAGATAKELSKHLIK